MAQQRNGTQRGQGAGRPTDRGRGTSRRAEQPRDAGAFIGRFPERATESIPGGIGPKDRRVSAGSTQPGAESPDAADRPEGHREGQPADDATVREAGQDR